MSTDAMPTEVMRTEAVRATPAPEAAEQAKPTSDPAPSDPAPSDPAPSDLAPSDLAPSDLAYWAPANTRTLTVVMAVAVFLSGAATLGVEIAASRVLAPYFGTSLFVWGALIGVVLAGLAMGYWAGGILADRWPTPVSLISVIGLGSVLVLLIPIADEWVLERIVSWDPGPRLNPLLAAVVLFAPCVVVLSCVSPIAVRLYARALESVGRTAGRLFSLSTVGSITGTFLTAFWLVPKFGVDQLIAYCSVVLFGAATVVAVVMRQRLLSAGGVAMALIALLVGNAVKPEAGNRVSAAAARDWSPTYRLRDERSSVPRETYEGLRVRFQKDTNYHRIAVVDDEKIRFLRFDSSYQSAINLTDEYATVFNYINFFHLIKAYNPKAREIAFLGLGGGSSIKRMWRDFPDMTIHVAELDPEVVSTARQWFKLPDDPKRMPIAAIDGRQFLAKDSRKYDAIAIDVYYSDGIPFHMATREFFELVKARLNPGGVVIMNSIGSLAGSDSKLVRSIVRTQQTVFPAVMAHPVFEYPGEDDESILNVMLTMTLGKPPTEAELLARWQAIKTKYPLVADVTKAITDRYDLPIATNDVPVLSDEYAPTDALLLDGI